MAVLKMASKIAKGTKWVFNILFSILMRKSCIHPHANPTIHTYTNPHKSTHPTQRHTHTHVHMLHVARVPAGVHWGGDPGC